jgi:GWxTD domain-containing protein
LIFALGVLLLQCNSRKNYTNKKSKNLVYTDNDLLEIKAAPYHVNDYTTDVYLEINNSNLLYKRTESSNKFFAEIKVSYTLVEEPNTKKMLDSSSYSMLDEEESETVALKALANNIQLECARGKKYFLYLEVIDVNRKSKNNSVITINKTNHWNIQNYKILYANKICCNNRFLNHQALKIISADKDLDRFIVDYYKTEAGPAAPPYSSKNNFSTEMKADSTFAIYKEHGSFDFNVPPSGFYFFKTNSQVNQGFAIYANHGSFPGIHSEDEMIKSCRYIMSKDEYENISTATNKKDAIDKFWLQIGGSKERAKEILKRYYMRVKNCNENFTSYKEGWKTDRGIIAIVFGEPTNVYHSKKDEIWVYGLETNPSSLRFVFNKVENVFSENDYVLERSDFYKDVFFQAVDFWRQGIVYTDRGAER